MLSWIESNGWWLGWTAAASAVSLLLIMLVVPFVVARMPADYFCHRHREPLYEGLHHPVVGMLVAGLKNLLGSVLVIFGIVMIFTPGQGVLTILLGVMLLNFPGKYHLELWLIQRPSVLPAINWLRARFKQPPLIVPKGIEPAEQAGKV